MIISIILSLSLTLNDSLDSKLLMTYIYRYIYIIYIYLDFFCRSKLQKVNDLIHVTIVLLHKRYSDNAKDSIVNSDRYLLRVFAWRVSRSHRPFFPLFFVLIGKYDLCGRGTNE